MLQKMNEQEYDDKLISGNPEVIKELSEDNDVEDCLSEEEYCDSELEEEDDLFDEENMNFDYDDNNISDDDLVVEEEEKIYIEDKNDNGVKIKYITGNERISFPFLTIFEKVLLIGTRSKQIANGSITTIDINTMNVDITPLNIAEEELKQKKIPFKIERPMPNGTIEIWDIDELEIFDN